MAEGRERLMWDGVALLASVTANVSGNLKRAAIPADFHPFAAGERKKAAGEKAVVRATVGEAKVLLKEMAGIK